MVPDGARCGTGDPEARDYLGHVHVNDTYWYIEAVPEFMQLATERLMQQRQEELS